MKVIAISGRAGAGKDTFAKMLSDALETYCATVLIVHYADLLKFICKAYFGWNGEKDAAGRRLLQTVGTNVIRDKDPDFWVDFVVKMLAYIGYKWEYVLIPDVRFPNEIDRLKAAGFDVQHWRVVRGDYDNGLSEEARMHPSETALDNVTPDVWIDNAGNLEELNEIAQKAAFFLDTSPMTMQEKVNSK